MNQHTTSNETTGRDAFEAWARKKGHDVVSRLETGGKFYVSSFTRHAWDIWQAARASLPQPSAEPVAWLYETDEDVGLPYMPVAGDAHDAIKELLNAFPVYRHPAAASPPIQVAPSEDEIQKLRTSLEWYKNAHDAVSGKLKAVWKGIADQVEAVTGKPCGPEPFDDLAALFAAPVPQVAPEQASVRAQALQEAASAFDETSPFIITEKNAQDRIRALISKEAT